VLGRDDIGAARAGHVCADLVLLRPARRVAWRAPVHDPVAALVFCTPASASLSVIDGKVRIRDGQFNGLDLPPLLARHRALARTLYERARHPHTA
jgi:hypothetical protein